MNHTTPGLPVDHHLPEFTQTHVHQVSDAIQPSHPLSSSFPPAPNPSQHQSFPMSQLFAWGGQSTGVSALPSFLPKNTQGWSPLEWTGWISLQSKGLSRVYSNTTVQKHQFFGAQLSSQSNSHMEDCLFFFYGFLEMGTSTDINIQPVLVFHQPLLLSNYVLGLSSPDFFRLHNPPTDMKLKDAYSLEGKLWPT